MKHQTIALELLRRNHQRYKLVAILCAPKPIAVAENDMRKGLHAEIHCIKRASKEKLVGAVIYVWRINNGGFDLAYPCEDCLAKIREVGIKKVIYSTKKGFGVLNLKEQA